MLLAIGLSGCVTVGSDKSKKWSQDDRATLHTQMGVNYFSQGQIEVAREELELALRIDPGHSMANHAMAQLERQFGNPERAGFHFARAVRNNPDNLSAHNDFGYYLCNKGETEKGLVQFNIASTHPLNKSRYVSIYGAGECELIAGNRDKAKALFRQTLELRGNTKQALLQLALINFEETEYLKTRGYLERFFQNNYFTDQSLVLAIKNELEMDNRKLAGEYAKVLRTQFPKSTFIGQLGALFRGGT
jgi:type IV pilus assembly protein PilF